MDGAARGCCPPPAETVLCAVSGGRDSVCLLHYLASLGRRRGFAVAAAHLTIGMRPTAGRDEAFVAGLCRSWACRSMWSGATSGPLRGRRAGAWRRQAAALRYDFLERTADAIGAARIATAHHLADQAETVVLNLLRGTGPEGLAGIPPVRGRLIRPLLQTPSRRRSRPISRPTAWATSRTRLTDTHGCTRNRLRLEVMAQLLTIHPAPTASICAGGRYPAARRTSFWIGWPARDLETAVSDCRHR